MKPHLSLRSTFWSLVSWCLVLAAVVCFLATVLVSESPSGKGYGPGINADGLANTTIGGPYLNTTSFGFRAARSGAIASIRVYIVWSKTSPGYSAGTGGSLLFSLQTDDSTSLHHPSGTTLASVLLTDPMAHGSFPLLDLSPLSNLNEGRIYHIVISNLDSDPTTNYVSVNSLWMENGLTPEQLSMADTEWFQLLGNSARPEDWVSRRNGNSDSFTPILELRYLDVYTTGMGYMEVWVGNPKTISGISSVRQYIKVSGQDQNVTKVSVRLRRTSGDDSLAVQLQDAEEATLARASVPASMVSVDYSWVTFHFPTAITLARRQEYYLRLSSPSTSVYELFPIRKGSSSNVGFSPATYFDDGHAEFTTGSGWIGWDQWGEPDRRDGDLQFMFAGPRSE